MTCPRAAARRAGRASSASYAPASGTSRPSAATTRGAARASEATCWAREASSRGGAGGGSGLSSLSNCCFLLFLLLAARPFSSPPPPPPPPPVPVPFERFPARNAPCTHADATSRGTAARMTNASLQPETNAMISPPPKPGTACAATPSASPAAPRTCAASAESLAARAPLAFSGASNHAISCLSAASSSRSRRRRVSLEPARPSPAWRTVPATRQPRPMPKKTRDHLTTSLAAWSGGA